MGLFNKKQDNIVYNQKLLIAVKKYIQALRNSGVRDKDIKKRLIQRGYEKKLVERSFKESLLSNNFLLLRDDEDELESIDESNINLEKILETLQLGKKYLIKTNNVEKTFELMEKRIRKSI